MASKSLYITSYMVAAIVGLMVALAALANAGLLTAWLGAAIACAGPVVFFGYIILMPRARTSRNLHLLIGTGLMGTALSVALGGSLTGLPVQIAAGVGVIGSLVYVFWYSRFGAPINALLTKGAQLPEFELTEAGTRYFSSELVAKPALWIFFRGNWCPLCMAQIEEIAAQYRELTRRGVEVILVSPQPQANSAALAKKMGVPMRFMTDANNRAAETLGILVPGGLPAGFQVLGYDSDVPRPAVFITEAGGKLIFCDLTDNYRVRPEPAQFFAVLDRHFIV